MNPIELLHKYYPGAPAREIMVHHSRLVADKALRVADCLPDRAIDRQFLEEAALLHDIGVCRTAAPDIGCHGTEPYIRHGILGREILEQEGLPRHALVCERHIGVGLTVADIRIQRLPLPERDMVPVTLEEKIISFADLFFSKKIGNLEEKPLDVVIESLARFSQEKVSIFRGWLEEFNCR